MKMIYSLNTQLNKVTGVEKVLMDIHHALTDDFYCKIVGTIKYEDVQPDHHIKKEEYIRWKNPFLFYGSIVIVHERKLLPILWMLNFFLFQKITILYIHHSILYGQKLTTILPKNIVAIANPGIKNLIEYFKVDKTRITKIHNCAVDIHPDAHKIPSNDDIKILYPARINAGKRQPEIVRRLRGRLDPRVKIYFAGDGPLSNELVDECADENQFIVLGYCCNILERLQKSDYMMLFSTHEGLPITLIEATMTGTPAICNNVGGNPEIIENNKNGFVLDKDDWDGLVDILNSLPDITTDTYREMSINGRKKYESEFTFEEFKKRYIELIKNI